MKNLFEQSRSHWVRYDRYELKTAADGKRYVTPAKDAKPDVYNPMKEMPGMVLDALNVGMLMMGRRTDVDVDAAILEFVTKYGLLGLMTALPTTPSFMDYEAVYLPKNHFIKAETMETEDYLALFYPFDKLDVVKKGVKSDWTVSGDRAMIALTMTFADEPMAKTMSFQREYAEPYDWVAQQFKDWAFTLTNLHFVLPRLRFHRRGNPEPVPQGDGGLWRDRAQLPHRAAGKADDLLGLPLTFAGHPDDVQLHVGGRCKAAAAVQALSESVYEQSNERRVLQRTVQEPV